MDRLEFWLPVAGVVVFLLFVYWYWKHVLPSLSPGDDKSEVR